jgi:hypothetical protein
VIAEAFLPGTEPYAASAGRNDGNSSAGWGGSIGDAQAPSAGRPPGSGGLY